MVTYGIILVFELILYNAESMERKKKMDYLGNLEIEKVIGREQEEEQLQAVLLQVNLRLLSFVMMIRTVTMVRVFLRQLRTSIQL